MAALIFAALIVLGDQLVKMWVTSSLELGARQQLIPGVVDLTRVHNTGASFGIFEGMRWPLVAVASVCVILLIVLITRFRNAWSRIGLAFALGGAVGNLIDRIIHGYVVDMFDPAFMSFYVFNVADCFVVIGAIIFFLSVIFTKDEIKTPPSSAEDQGKKQSGATASTIFGGTVKDLSETKILEEYDIERLLREYNSDEKDD